MNNVRHQSIVEAAPLLETTRRSRSYTTGDLIARHNRKVRMNSVASSMHFDNDTSSILTALNSVRDYVKEKYPSLTTRKFIAAILWSLAAIAIFNLIFLPRTSLARDYRRVHFSALTRDDTERLFIKALNDENRAGAYLKAYMDIKHLSGDGDALVQYTMDELRGFGLQPYKEVYNTWMTDHIDSSLSLLNAEGDVVYQPSLLEEDPVTGHKTQGFHAYSANGDITTEYIYANYGSLEDYRLLRAHGVDLKRKIHIVRSGKVISSLQLRHAELFGASGVITYMDTSDDGEVTLKNGYAAYPDGPARNTGSLRRDTVLPVIDSPGDPTTIGYSSQRGAKHTAPKNLPKIPSFPMSFDEITPILLHLQTPQIGNWTGDIPGFNYSPGPSTFKLHMTNKNEGDIRPIKNIMYEIPGLLNEKIILGNHRDSFTSHAGAGDPGSGYAVLLEISRAFSELIKHGWRPLRTIVVASWDSNEFGMLGSTEYGERYESDLQKHAIAYINMDMGVTGHELDIVANPLLDHFLITTSKEIPFNNYTDAKSLFDYWRESQPLGGQTIRRLSSGSDYTVFQHHLGIPSCDVGFHQDRHVAPPVNHHSAFDSLDWMERFVDPGFLYHGTLAKYLGFLALSFSEHEVIEYKVSHYSDEIKFYFDDIVSRIPQHWWDRDLERGTNMALTVDHMKYILDVFGTVSSKFDDAAESLQHQFSIDYPWFQFYIKLRAAIQGKVMGNKAKEIDQMFLHRQGLSQRPWMRHLIFAPDRDTGFDTSYLPSLSEHLQDDEFELFVKAVQDLMGAVKRATKRLML